MMLFLSCSVVNNSYSCCPLLLLIMPVAFMTVTDASSLLIYFSKGYQQLCICLRIALLLMRIFAQCWLSFASMLATSLYCCYSQLRMLENKRKILFLLPLLWKRSIRSIAENSESFKPPGVSCQL